MSPQRTLLEPPSTATSESSRERKNYTLPEDAPLMKLRRPVLHLNTQVARTHTLVATQPHMSTQKPMAARIANPIPRHHSVVESPRGSAYPAIVQASQPVQHLQSQSALLVLTLDCEPAGQPSVAQQRPSTTANTTGTSTDNCSPALIYGIGRVQSLPRYVGPTTQGSSCITMAEISLMSDAGLTAQQLRLETKGPQVAPDMGLVPAPLNIRKHPADLRGSRPSFPPGGRLVGRLDSTAEEAA